MKITEVDNTVIYEADTGDWHAFMRYQDGPFSIEFRCVTGSYELGSGSNYDNLVTFIGQVKADALERNANWDGN